MKGLVLVILFFLISFSAQSQSEIKILIGKTKEEVKTSMTSQSTYTLNADTVHINLGELLHYKLQNYSDSSILQNRILTITFFFAQSQCDEIRLVLFGEDALIGLVDRLNSTHKRVGVNVWVDQEVKIGIRISQLPSIENDESDIALFQIDITALDLWKH